MQSSPALPRQVISWFLLHQRLRLVGAVLAGVLTIASSVCLLGISAYLIERASQRPPILSLMVAIVAVRFFGIARGVFRYVDRLLSHDASFRLLGELRADLYRRLIPLAPAGLHDLGHGDLLTRIAADVDTLQEWFVRGFTPVCVSIITAVLAVLAAGIILPAAGVLLALCLALSAAVTVTAARTRGAATAEIALRGAVSAGVVEYLQGLPDLIALDADGEMRAAIQAREQARERRAARRARRNAVVVAVQTALPGMMAVVLALAGIHALGTGLNPLSVGVLVFGGMAAAECIAALPGAVGAWERGYAAAQRLTDLAATPAPTGTGEMEVAPEAAQVLTLSHVSFRHREGSPWVLRDLNLRVHRGERVVIVGPSGAGKTSLASLLLRFASPREGTVSLNGTDLQELSEASVRGVIGAATQHAHLFAGTIRDNIRLARPAADDQELAIAAAEAQLTDWIDGLPDGWNTDVGERGVTVSGGQRRRIALARALLARFPFVIADEPTEGLDTETAAAVMSSLFQASEGHGLIVITHRPDLCPPPDAIYRLTDGRLERMAAFEPAHRPLIRLAGT